MSTVEPLVWTKRVPGGPGTYLMRERLGTGWHVRLMNVIQNEYGYLEACTNPDEPDSYNVIWMSTGDDSPQWAPCPKDFL